jgi:hypothetical protein
MWWAQVQALVCFISTSCARRFEGDANDSGSAQSWQVHLFDLDWKTVEEKSRVLIDLVFMTGQCYGCTG